MLWDVLQGCAQVTALDAATAQEKWSTAIAPDAAGCKTTPSRSKSPGHGAGRGQAVGQHLPDARRFRSCHGEAKPAGRTRSEDCRMGFLATLCSGDLKARRDLVAVGDRCVLQGGDLLFGQRQATLGSELIQGPGGKWSRR